MGHHLLSGDDCKSKSPLNHIWSPPKQDKRNNEEGGIRIEGEDRAGGGGEQLGVEGGAGHLNIKQALPRSPGNDADLAGVDQQGGARGLAPWERGGVVANFERCVEPGCHRTIHQVGFPTSPAKSLTRVELCTVCRMRHQVLCWVSSYISTNFVVVIIAGQAVGVSLLAGLWVEVALEERPGALDFWHFSRPLGKARRF